MNTTHTHKIISTLLVLWLAMTNISHAQPNDDTVDGWIWGTTGVIIRDVECRDQFGNTVDPSFCSGAGPMPETRQTAICSTGSSTTSGWVVTYSRDIGDRWQCVDNLSCQPIYSTTENEQICGALSLETCGTQPLCMAQSNGTSQQTRDIVCRDQNGIIVADNLCPQPKPDTTQPCSNVVYNSVYFWHKVDGTCGPSQAWAVCQWNGYTNEKITRDGIPYNWFGGESIDVQDLDDNRCVNYYAYEVYPQGSDHFVWRISEVACNGWGGADWYSADTLRDGCSINTDPQSCNDRPQAYGTDQWGVCNWIQVQDERIDTFICRDLWGNTVADSFCTYAPKPADIHLSCDQWWPWDPNSQNQWQDRWGGIDPDCVQDGPAGCGDNDDPYDDGPYDPGDQDWWYGDDQWDYDGGYDYP